MDHTLGDIPLDDADRLGQFGHGGGVIACLNYRPEMFDLIPHTTAIVPVPRTTHGVLTYSLYRIFVVGQDLSLSHSGQQNAKRRAS